MTINIWNYEARWNRRRSQIADLILTHQPDAVALQETRHDFRFERGKGQGDQLADLTGYKSTWACAQVYIPLLRVDEGLTILTREPPLDSMVTQLSLHPRDREDENHRICLGVTIAVDGREVCVYDTHFSLSAAARETNAVECSRFVREQSSGRTAVLMGDLNAEPDARSIQFLRGSESIGGVTSDFIDCWTATHSTDPGFTYASWDPVRRIDYVFGRNVRADSLKAEIIGTRALDETYPSDHMGILVELDPV